jgi:hypothetical protein
MNKRKIMAEIIECANYLDNCKLTGSADDLTQVAIRLSQFDNDFEGFPEPYENDLQEFSDREAWEDMRGDREDIDSPEQFDEEGFPVQPETSVGFGDPPDALLEQQYEDRTDLGDQTVDYYN